MSGKKLDTDPNSVPKDQGFGFRTLNSDPDPGNCLNLDPDPG